MKRLSVIIVTYQSENDIYDCLKTVWECCDIPKEELEVIVVDNSPHCEPMFSNLRHLYGEDIVLIHNTHNGGYGQGNNVGIRRASAPVILIMNPDVRLLEPFFRKPLCAFQENKQLIMYGMKMMNTTTQASTNSFWCTTMMNGYLRTLLTGLCTRMDCYLPRWMYLSGSCFFVRKSMFEAVGLFDESVFMYGEEDDIHYRLAKHFGYHFLYDKHLHYLHPMEQRLLTVDYEKKILEADLYHHQKKGRSPLSTLQTYLQINTTLLARAYIRKILGRQNEADFAKLKGFRSILKKMYKDYSTSN